jgi:hypothetical protein
LRKRRQQAIFKNPRVRFATSKERKKTSQLTEKRFAATAPANSGCVAACITQLGVLLPLSRMVIELEFVRKVRGILCSKLVLHFSTVFSSSSVPWFQWSELPPVLLTTANSFHLSFV